jgi:hypothetical protein
MDEDILGMLLATLVVLVPLAGITMRFALKPLIDSLIRIAEVRRSTQEVQILERRVALLEQELGSVRSEMKEIASQNEFYRKLSEPSIQ